MNFSRVASDNPSIFSASRLTNSAKAFTCFAWQSGLVQYNAFALATCLILVAPPHTGHLKGMSDTPLLVRFLAICGMIIFALYTSIRSPIPSSSSSMILILWTLARLTVVPSSSTGSKIATGLISPVLDGLHSISTSFVSRISSAHLKAKESLGNFDVRPRDRPYAISSYISTRPSDGKSFSAIFSEKLITSASTVSAVTSWNSTTSNP